MCKENASNAKYRQQSATFVMIADDVGLPSVKRWVSMVLVLQIYKRVAIVLYWGNTYELGIFQTRHTQKPNFTLNCPLSYRARNFYCYMKSQSNMYALWTRIVCFWKMPHL